MKYLTAKVMGTKAAALNRAAFKAVPGEPIRALTARNGKECARHTVPAERLG